ncbi:MAG: AAA family ATPase [Verrucomicrobiota bacterium]|jgi:MoxR-like ATPase
MPKLTILDGPQQGQTVTVGGAEFIIGRDPECQWQLDLPSVSRHHVRIFAVAGQWRIRDLGSSNGTKRNGQEIEESELVTGDRLSIGDVPVVFEDGVMPAVVTSESDIQAIVTEMSRKTRLIEAEIGKAIIGQKAVVMQLLTAIISKGHVLMIGMPGLAKTMMIRTLSEVLDLQFRRIQFTPDLMPSDITGTDVLEADEETGKKEYRFIKGPIFTNILLADEINRTPPKTQAALLEAMQEHRVTASGQTYQLDLPFFVLATQNPLEQEGTYPLPEAQLDRFMFSVYIDYPDEQDEETIAKVTTGQQKVDLKKVLTGEEILKLQDVVRGMPVSDHVVKFATRLVRSTRPGDARAPEFIKKWIHCGAGPRASQFLVVAAKANAVIAGRLLVTADDVRQAARSVLRHRMFTNFAADSEGMDTDKIVQKLLETVPEPGEKDY